MRGGSVTNGSTIAENAGHGIDVLMSQADVTGNDTIRDNSGFRIGGARLVDHDRREYDHRKPG